MTPINKALVGIAILLLLLLITIDWQQQHDKPTPLTPLQPQQVKRIAINNLLFFHKQKDLWLTDNPGQTVNQERIWQLLRITQTPSLRRFAASPENIRAFVLDKPAYRLQLDDLELLFGTTDPINHWRYVQVGDSIHLIGDGFLHHLQAPMSGFLQTSPAAGKKP